MPQIYMSVYLSIYQSINLSIYISIYLSIHPSIYLSIYLSGHPRQSFSKQMEELFASAHPPPKRPRPWKPIFKGGLRYTWD